MEKVIEEYKLIVDDVSAKVQIIKPVFKSPIYRLVKSEIAVPTMALLDEVKNKLIERIKLSSEEILDQKIIEKLKDRFRSEASIILKEYLNDLSESTKTYLIGTLIHDSLGLGDMEFLLHDPLIEEIVVSSAKEPVRIYHKKHGWLETNITMQSEDQILNYSNVIARRIGRQITNLNPLLDAHLLTGDRVNAVLYPIATKGNTITLRKFSTDPITVTDMIKSNISNSEVFALIWLALEYEMNMLISGGTASGKTTFLNVCMPFIPTNHRIISIEDTRELYLPKELYWTPLVTRPPNPEGEGQVTMLDLLVNSLRMRPDRIILGEMRRKAEAEVLFEAMHTGHSVYATVHADSSNETIKRLVNPPIEVPENLLEQVHLNVVMFRDRKKGIRRTYQVSEFVFEGSETSIKPNLLYRWNPANDKIVKHMESLKLIEQLTRNTGSSQTELDKDLAMRRKILEWMVKKNLRDIREVGSIMKNYYLDKDYVMKIVNKNSDAKSLMEND